MFSKMSIYISTADDHIEMFMSDFETSGYIDLINTSFLCHYISTKKSVHFLDKWKRTSDTSFEAV